jgi:hypothetical protein
VVAGATVEAVAEGRPAGSALGGLALGGLALGGLALGGLALGGLALGGLALPGPVAACPPAHEARITAAMQVPRRWRARTVPGRACVGNMRVASNPAAGQAHAASAVRTP